MADRAMPVAWGVLVLAFVVGGCRTYGSYDAAEELLGKIRQATQLFAEELERSRGDQEALQRAAAANPALAGVAARFAAVVARQEALVVEQHALAEAAAAGGNILFAWVGPDSYRRLHATFGAIISDQQVVRDRYAEVLRDLEESVGASLPAQAAPPQSRYQIVPPFYERIRSASGRRSVADILTQARQAAAIQPGPSE